MVFSGKYRWPEHYFLVWCLRNSQKLLTTNQFLVSTMFFTIMNISFFNLCFYLFLIIIKEVNQIRNNVLCFSLPCFRILLCFHYRLLQCFSTYFRKYIVKYIVNTLVMMKECYIWNCIINSLLVEINLIHHIKTYVYSTNLCY